MQKYKIMNIKTFFLVCFLLTFFNIATFGQAKDKVAKVVIDAGHGGSMPGAVGKVSKEKDINLKVALQVGKLISDNFEDVTIIYTREKDETVELFKRAEIANKNKADLFISIHCNSAENKNASGIETFVMGLEKSADSYAVAKKENADILLEKDYQTNYSDFSPNSPEAHIIFSLYSSAYLNWSTIFASKVQKHLVNNTNMIDRNVRQGIIFVLYKVAMPSILIELGFICNAEEEKYLLREDTQELMALSIYNAFVEYKNLMEGTSKPFLPVVAIPRTETIIEHEVAPEADTLLEAPEAENTPEAPEAESTPKTQEVPKALEVFETPEVFEAPEVPKTIDLPEAEIAPNIPDTQVAPDTQVTTAPPANNISFRVQFFLSKENLNISDKRFSSQSEVNKYYDNGFWKYTSGDFKTLAEAQSKLKEVKKNYSDAFIVAFNNERRITLSEAQDLLK